MGVGLAVVTGSWMTVLCVCDIRRRRLPNLLTLPGVVIIVLVAAAAGRGLPALAGGAVLGALYLAVHLMAPGAMGAGDVKLALGLGALTGTFGPDVWALAALVAPLLSAVLAVGCVLRGAGGTIPHGPSMCAASLAAVALAVL